MPPAFYASIRYRQALPGGVEGVAGSMIFPSGIALPTLARRKLDRCSHLRRRLLDPQLYLSVLEAVACRGACAKLLSYGWFTQGGAPVYDSSEYRQSDWLRMLKRQVHTLWTSTLPSDDGSITAGVRACVEVQIALDCEAIILPVPLTRLETTDYATELRWLDIGIDVCEELSVNRPVVASIPIADCCLCNVDPATNPVLDLITDQVTARGLWGAYIVTEVTQENTYHITNPNTVGSVLRLIHGLKSGGIACVIVAGLGMASLLAVAAGADIWCSGWYRGERRVKLADFQEADGRSVPTYYSHPLAGELHLESDLDRAVHAGLLPLIQDVTQFSRPLVTALNAGRPAGSVPDWEHRFTNVTYARAHFTEVAVRETGHLALLPEVERLDAVARWLEGAEVLAGRVSQLGTLNPRTEIRHQAGWQRAFTRFRAELG